MGNLRLIARLDIKGPNLIKGVQLECLRIMGDPQIFAQNYYADGVDELLYMDIVASLYNRNNLEEIVRYTAQNIFVPLTVGGGIRSIENANSLLRAGADKIAINTAAIRNPTLITDLAERFGSQCVVASIEAKRISDNQWEAYTDNGRESTGLNAIAWAKQCEALGAGEILLTSVDQEGTRKGYDVELTRRVSQSVSIPVIASGGMGTLQHLVDVVKDGHADAVAMADFLHYNRMSLKNIRSALLQVSLPVRQV